MNKNNNQSHYKLNEKNNLFDLQESWLLKDTVDFWRHSRMCTPIIPIVKAEPGSSWITIGDGRLGLDSIRLKRYEPLNFILPTDIDTILLEKAKQMKLIEEYKRENAEKLSVANESFDYSFCKESYHHFQKPYMALYEMMRVSRKAIILIEPSDTDKKPLILEMIDKLKKIIKTSISMTKKHPDYYRFEDSGNYVYTVSKRDIEKAAIAMQMPMIAIYNFNDYYKEGVEFISTQKYSNIFIKIKIKIALRNFLSKLGFAMYTGIIAIIFKERPTEKLIKQLKDNGFEFTELPINPYLKLKNKLNNKEKI
jgi:ubiquinone/menaquinone biosynthesis C-methylase UbiE